MREGEVELLEHQVDVAVVTFDRDAMARSYVEQTKLPWPLLIDSTRSVYETYGFGRGSAWAIYGPASIWNYLKLILGKRRRVEKPGSDYRQLGGDVLIDPKGRLRFHYASTSPHDRPDVQQILGPIKGSRRLPE